MEKPMSTDTNTNTRGLRIVLWLFIWALIQPLALYTGNIGFGMGTPVSNLILFTPLGFMAAMYSIIIRSEPSFLNGKLNIEVVVYLIFIYTFISLVILKKTRSYLSKLVDFPYIEAFFWGVLSVFFIFGPFNQAIYVLFFPGFISTLIAEKIFGKDPYTDAGQLYFPFDLTANVLAVVIAFIVLKNISSIVNLIRRKKDEHGTED